MGNVFSCVKRQLFNTMAGENKALRLDSADNAADLTITHTIHDTDALVRRYADLFMQERFSDIVLKVGDQRFPAHRFVLITSSEVFEAMLSQSRWKEARQPEICLTEEEECIPEFEHFLRYLYSGEAVLKTMSVLPLLLLADKYEVDCLRASCLQFMMDHVVQAPNTNRALTWYQYAQMTGQTELRDKCLSFILSNFDIVMQACDWPFMLLEELTGFLALSDMVVDSEPRLWRHVQDWLQHPHNLDQLDSNLREILPHMRFSMMAAKVLVQVEESPLYSDHKQHFTDKLNRAFRAHSLALESQAAQTSAAADSQALPLSHFQEPYRNYKNADYVVCHDFKLPEFLTINKIDTRVALDVKARPKFMAQSRAQPDDLTHFSAYFFPRGYFTTLTIYGSYMGRQNNDVTLKVIRRRPDLVPMKVEVSLLLQGKQNDLRYAAFSHSWTTVFSKDNHTLSVDKFLLMDKLMQEDSPYLINGALEGSIFLKIQDVGNHLLEVKDEK